MPGTGPTRSTDAASTGSPAMRQAGRELLSLALIEARNTTLDLLARYERAWHDALQPPGVADVALRAALRLAGHIGWFAEWWIGRNTQRAYGAACPARATRLASIEPHADLWWATPDADVQAPGAADAVQVRAYLLETLESTLEMLAHAGQADAGLYFYRLALLHEDLCCEQLLQLAQREGVPLGLELPGPATQREPLQLPAVRWQLGAPPAGFCFAHERGAHEVPVPEFEIDAQPVAWNQFVEFVDDGGYDRAELWSPQGWIWVQQQGRRAPRYVEQIGAGRGGGVLQRRFGSATRVAGTHAAVHLSWWEADAWARWAGRRIATEVEWEVAAHHAARRGWRWGEVHEWTAGTLQPWPGYQPDTWSMGTAFDPQASFRQARVLRGASFATPPRLHWLRARNFATPERDDGFFGFRTCAL